MTDSASACQLCLAVSPSICSACHKAEQSAKNTAYNERNRAVALIARMAVAMGYRAWLGIDHDEDADSEWRTVVFVDLPTGQVSWHVNFVEAHLFAGLPTDGDAWDRHTTEDKNNRMQAAFSLRRRLHTPTELYLVQQLAQVAALPEGTAYEQIGPQAVAIARAALNSIADED